MRICKVWFADGRIYGEAEDGRVLWQSMLYYRRLLMASVGERQRYELTQFGIHWPDIDEDISYESFEYPDPEPVGVGKIFLTHPEINASAVARRLGMKQSLLAAYISGTKRPSPQREQQIIDELRLIGRELAAL